jgi:cell division protein FtsW (lipid II flippase)
MRPGGSSPSWLTGILDDEKPDNDRREALLLGLAFVFLLAGALAILIAPAARSGELSDTLESWQHLVVLPIWAVCAWIVRRVLRRTRPQRDPFLLPCAMLLAGWGMLIIWRLTPAFGARQTAWFLVACVILIELLRAPQDLRWLRRYRYLWLLAGIVLVLLTLIFGTNPSGGDPRLWLGCCGLYFQPSEPLRLLLVAYLASYMADRMVLEPRKDLPSLLPLLSPIVLVWVLSVVLLAVQHDLGTGILFLSLLAVLLYIASGRWEVLGIASAAAVAAAIIGYNAFDIVRVRMQAWINPWVDPTGGSYQIVQSLIAFASGGILGRGPGAGSPGLVPIAHSDFIFAAVGEEWGFIGALAMIMLVLFLTTRGLRVALRSRDHYGAMLAAGLSLAFGLQAFFIMAGVTRLLPLTGVTLPFVSYGGSSLVTSFIALGLLLLLSGGEGSGQTMAGPLIRVQAGSTVMGLGLALVVGWWSVYRAPILVARTDNPRRSMAERYALRGSILDTLDRPLATSIGERGSYTRTYPSEAAAPVTGYDSASYGQTGVEASMDDTLRGPQGQDLFENTWHQFLTGFPLNGLDVRLTLDMDLQEAAARGLGSRVGAAVVLEPYTGAIRALASSPSYDPNRLDETWPDLVSRTDAPLLNRATQAQYQPGTSIGPFVAAWGEELGLVNTHSLISNPAETLTIDGHELACARADEGSAAPILGATLRAGCPAPSAEIGARIGGAKLADMIEAFGLEAPPPIRLQAPTARAPEVADTEAQVRLAAVGQGGLVVTPLQVARAFASFVNGGVLPALQLVEAYRQPDGSWQGLPPTMEAKQAISSEAATWAEDQLRPLGSDILQVSALSLSGPGDERIAWFLAAQVSRPPARVVVVAIEGGTVEEAERVGLSLLQ